MANTVTVVCQICGEEFQARPCDIKRGRSKFCSPECGAASKRTERKICPVCGKNEVTKWNKTCSRECARALAKEKKARETLKPDKEVHFPYEMPLYDESVTPSMMCPVI